MKLVGNATVLGKKRGELSEENTEDWSILIFSLDNCNKEPGGTLLWGGGFFA